LGEAGQREGRGGILFELSDHFRGSSVPRSRQREVLVLAQGVVEGVERTRGRVAELLDAVLHFMSENVEDRGEYERRMRITGVERRDPAWRRIALAAEDLCLSLGEIGQGLDRLHTALEPLCDLLEYESLMLEISSAVQHAAELRGRIESIVCGQEGGGDEKVCWLSLKGDVLTLCAAPLHVGPVLRDSLFSHKECVVLTSATLSTGGNFEYIKGRLSLEDAGELLLCS
jgi:DNA polymerase-3 subunit epsilon/ATP-dependent DNA helicase DinG